MVGLGSIVRVKCEDRDKTILLLFSVLILCFLLQCGNRFNSWLSRSFYFHHYTVLCCFSQIFCYFITDFLSHLLSLIFIFSWLLSLGFQINRHYLSGYCKLSSLLFTIRFSRRVICSLLSLFQWLYFDFSYTTVLTHDFSARSDFPKCPVQRSSLKPQALSSPSENFSVVFLCFLLKTFLLYKFQETI